PRSGNRTAVNFDLGSSLFGGTNNFYKAQLDSMQYAPLPWGDLRVSVRGRYGFVENYHGSPIPLTEKFFVGGINTMRGFVFGRAGPVTSSGSLLGSDTQVILNFDFIVPISTEAKLNASIFFDYGQGFLVGETIDLFNLRKAAGLEGRWISPFGPLRAAYGLNLQPRSGEKPGVFEFTVGSLF